MGGAESRGGSGEAETAGVQGDIIHCSFGAPIPTASQRLGTLAGILYKVYKQHREQLCNSKVEKNLQIFC